MTVQVQTFKEALDPIGWLLRRLTLSLEKGGPVFFLAGGFGEVGDVKSDVPRTWHSKQLHEMILYNLKHEGSGILHAPPDLRFLLKALQRPGRPGNRSKWLSKSWCAC